MNISTIRRRSFSIMVGGKQCPRESHAWPLAGCYIPSLTASQRELELNSQPPNWWEAPKSLHCTSALAYLAKGERHRFIEWTVPCVLERWSSFLNLFCKGLLKIRLFPISKCRTQDRVSSEGSGTALSKEGICNEYFLTIRIQNLTVFCVLSPPKF